MRIVFFPLLLLLTLLASASGQVQAPEASKASLLEQHQTEARAAWQTAFAAATRGPATVTLVDQATLRVPAGMMFLPAAEAQQLTRALGNTAPLSLVGIVTTPSDDDQWMIYVTWTKEGFIRDGEAKDLNADDILANLREDTEEANKQRVARGFQPLELGGWTQPPVYDASIHRLAWALLVTSPGEATGNGTINFNTRALGREGFFSLNLVTEESTIGRDRAVSNTLLSSLDYNEGKRYQDFNGSTDRVAEYGLPALIGVVAAKKLGLLAIAGLFLAKFAKVGLLAVAGGGMALRRFFRRKPSA